MFVGVWKCWPTPTFAYTIILYLFLPWRWFDARPDLRDFHVSAAGTLWLRELMANLSLPQESSSPRTVTILGVFIGPSLGQWKVPGRLLGFSEESITSWYLERNSKEQEALCLMLFFLFGFRGDEMLSWAAAPVGTGWWTHAKRRSPGLHRSVSS